MKKIPDRPCLVIMFLARGYPEEFFACSRGGSQEFFACARGYPEEFFACSRKSGNRIFNL